MYPTYFCDLEQQARSRIKMEREYFDEMLTSWSRQAKNCRGILPVLLCIGEHDGQRPFIRLGVDYRQCWEFMTLFLKCGGRGREYLMDELVSTIHTLKPPVERKIIAS